MYSALLFRPQYELKKYIFLRKWLSKVAAAAASLESLDTALQLLLLQIAIS
jgi:hypothetical protein